MSNCEQGIRLKALSLLVTSPVYNDIIIPQVHYPLTKVALVDTTLIRDFSAVHVHVANSWDVASRVFLSWENAAAPVATVLISEEFDGVYGDFVMAEEIDDPATTFPEFDVYTGYLNFSHDNLLAHYSENNRNQTLPQRFGGKIRTLLIRNCGNSLIVLKEPKILKWSEHLKPDGRFNYPDETTRKIFQPQVRRIGFMRANWMDGSYIENSTSLLEFDEAKIHLYYTFTFETPCEDAELVLTTIVAGERENITCSCDNGSVTLASRGIRAELFGDAVVNYQISDKNNCAGNCPDNGQNITLNDTYTLLNFQYVNITYPSFCAINFFITMDSYFLIKYERYCPDGYSSNTFFSSGDYSQGGADDVEQKEYMFEPPKLGVHISVEANLECYYVNYTIAKIKLSPFDRTKRIQPDQDEPHFVDLATLEAGITYIYEVENGMRLYRLYSNRHTVKLANYVNIFIYNGTDKNAQFVGTFGAISQFTKLYSEKGAWLKSLSLHVEVPAFNSHYNNKPQDPSKLLLVEASVVGDFSALYVHMVDNWYYGNRNFLSWEKETEMPIAVLLISEEDSDGGYADFIMAAQSVDTYTGEPTILSEMEVYAGYFNFSQSNMIAYYSETNKDRTLPQRFGGKMRTLLICSYGNATMVFRNPINDRKITGGLLIYSDPTATTIFQPKVGRIGFLRTNWLDGSYRSNATNVLEFDEPTEEIHLYYTFTFEPPCEGAELVLTTIVLEKMENFTYTCDDGSVTLASRGIRAELFGYAVYQITMDSYFLATYQRHCPEGSSSQLTFISNGNYFGTFDDEKTKEYTFEPPELGVEFIEEMNPECYYINFTIVKVLLSPFEQKKQIPVNVTTEPYFIDLATLEAGFTYIYESKQAIRLYRLFCEMYSIVLSNYVNVFIYNGADKNAQLIGTFATGSLFTKAYCIKGVLLEKLALHVVEAVLNNDISRPQEYEKYSKLALVDGSLSIDCSAVQVYVANIWYPLSRSNILSWEDTPNPFAVLLISEMDPEGIYGDFVMNPISGIVFPNIEVYAGYFNFSVENLIAQYSESNKIDMLPQHFGGKIRTLKVRGINGSAVIINSPILDSYYKDRRTINGDHVYPDSAFTKTFQPEVGRTGFMRTNWLDGSYRDNSTKPNNESTHMYYTFTFNTPCYESELFITTIVNGSQENFTCTCADGSVTLASRGIRAELCGDAVVDYRLSDKENCSDRTQLSYFFPFVSIVYILRVIIQPFNETKIAHIKASDEPLFIPIANFKPGVTYVYEADHDILFYRPYCEIASSELPKFPNIFFFNGTNSSAELVGSFSSKFLSSLDECVSGYTLNGLSIFLVEESEPNFNYSELLIMDSSYKRGLSSLYVNVINLFEPDFVDYVNILWQGHEDKPFVALLLSHEERPGYYPEFQFMGLRDPSKKPISLARFPYIEVYAGYLNFSQSNLFARYVEADRNTAIPQKFGGKARTFFVRPRETIEIPMTFANSTVGQWKEPEPGTWGTAYPGDYLAGAYQPFFGRRGFLRNNWLDGSPINNYVLELDEPLDDSHFYYTLTFADPCNNAKLLVTTIINMTEEQSTYNCTDGTFQVISRGLRVELQGDTVVEYSIGDSKSCIFKIPYYLSIFIPLSILYVYTK